MIQRNQAFETENGEFSILSWNILAPDFDRNGTMDWSEERLPSILLELQTCNSDILCLQEMQKNSMERDFIPALVKNGNYEGMYCEENDVSVATFWKRGKYELQHIVNKNRSMIVILRENTQHNTCARSLAVINVHLDEHPEHVFTRVQQLQSLMKEVRSHQSGITGTVLCGDFGCPQRQSACTSYLKGDGPLDSVIENNQLFDLTSCIHPHSLELAPSYSFAQLPTSLYFTWGIDQLWYTPTRLKTKQLRDTYSSDEQRAAILEEGLPSRWNPSDHMPIGAVMEWQNMAVDDVIDDCDYSAKKKSQTNAIFDQHRIVYAARGFFQDCSEVEKFLVESCVNVLLLWIDTTVSHKETSEISTERCYDSCRDKVVTHSI
mmetsp:Transcript_2390/g.3663  ORF Transcript_2390/g.3663 Transcript_2390/m.3663 type:complete len:377 (+) Transcript_2390:47-1177(+)